MAITPLPLASEFLFRMVLHAGTPQMSATSGGKELRVIPGDEDFAAGGDGQV